MHAFVNSSTVMYWIYARFVAVVGIRKKLSSCILLYCNLLITLELMNFISLTSLKRYIQVRLVLQLYSRRHCWSNDWRVDDEYRSCGLLVLSTGARTYLLLGEFRCWETKAEVENYLQISCLYEYG